MCVRERAATRVGSGIGMMSGRCTVHAYHHDDHDARKGEHAAGYVECAEHDVERGELRLFLCVVGRVLGTWPGMQGAKTDLAYRR